MDPIKNCTSLESCLDHPFNIKALEDFFHNQGPKVYVLGGPTASGKSALGLQLAQRYNLGPIVNGDSIQRYGGLPILGASPGTEDFKKWPHRGYGMTCPFSGSRLNGAQWVEETKIFVEESLRENKSPLVVGGTGLYLQNLCFGDFCYIPPIDPQKKAQWEEEFSAYDLDKKRQLISAIDEPFAQRFSDGQRLLRAYVVYKGTGKTLTYWQEQHRNQQCQKKSSQGLPEEYSFVPMVIWPPKDILHHRAKQRWISMIQEDVFQEVMDFCGEVLSRIFQPKENQGFYFPGLPMDQRSSLLKNLYPFYEALLDNTSWRTLGQKSFLQQDLQQLLLVLSKNPLYCTLGFKEILHYIFGFSSLETCEEKYLIATHQYIKRQRTWLRHKWIPRVILSFC